MNEEMYEEEDDDIPWRYRNVTSHLPINDGLFSRRLQSMLAVQLENQRLLGQAVNSTLQHNPQFQNQNQFISPGMMQMPQTSFQNTMLPPQHLNRMSTGFRQGPYPQQSVRPSPHQRSASIATPQDLAHAQKYQFDQSPVQQHNSDGRRMSLPPSAMQAAAPQPGGPQRSPSYTSQQDSTPNTPTNHPQQQNQSQISSSIAGQSNPLAPFTTTLPMETQQLLASTENFPGLYMSGTQQQYPMKPQQPFYSYRPNSSSGKDTPKNVTGLNQTLLGNTLDTSVGSNQSNGLVDTPDSAYSLPLYSAGTDTDFSFGFDDNMFPMQQFGTTSGLGSGQITPGVGSGYNEPLFNDFLDQDMFGESNATHP
jgi:hypothetical protein